jgi:hypothetical protein
MFILDETADEIVRNHAKLQDLVHGRTAMVWLPGQGAGVGAQACLMFGGAATGLSVLWLSTITVQHFMYFMIGAAIFAAVHGATFYAVLRGRPQARTHTYRFGIAMVSLSTCIAITCLVRGAKVPLTLAAAGFAFNVLAMRLISGPSYALLSAIFRAQRAHMDSH